MPRRFIGYKVIVLVDFIPTLENCTDKGSLTPGLYGQRVTYTLPSYFFVFVFVFFMAISGSSARDRNIR
jgi:hypothetical protein